MRHDLNGGAVGSPTHWEAQLQAMTVPRDSESLSNVTYCATDALEEPVHQAALWRGLRRDGARRSSTWMPARANMLTRVSMLNNLIFPRTRSLIRGWVTPKSFAAAFCVSLRARIRRLSPTK